MWDEMDEMEEEDKNEKRHAEIIKRETEELERSRMKLWCIAWCQIDYVLLLDYCFFMLLCAYFMKPWQVYVVTYVICVIKAVSQVVYSDYRSSNAPQLF